MAYTKPRQRRKFNCHGERDKIRFIVLEFQGGKLRDSVRVEESKTFHRLHVLGDK